MFGCFARKLKKLKNHEKPKNKKNELFITHEDEKDWGQYNIIIKEGESVYELKEQGPTNIEDPVTTAYIAQRCNFVEEKSVYNDFFNNSDLGDTGKLYGDTDELSGEYCQG